MFRTRKVRRSGQPRPLRLAARPSVESLDRRELLATVTPFIQGTAFLDANGTGVRTSTEAGLAGATVNLYLGSTQVGTTTTAANGTYLFNSSNVTGGLTVGSTYKLVESAAGYSNTGAQALSQLDPASVTAANTIQVTVVNPNSVSTTYTGPTSNNNNNDAIAYTFNGASHATIVNLLNFTVTGGAIPASTSINTLCVGLTQDLATSKAFPANIDPQSALLNDGGQIAYLFNHYGLSLPPTGQLPAAIQGLYSSANSADATKNVIAGLQVAVWELEYNSGSSTGTFVPTAAYPPTFFTSTSAQDYADLITAANAFVADATGKSEVSDVLDASLAGTPAGTVTSGGQSILAAGSYNFGNAPSANDSISGIVYIDATGVGLTGPANTPPPTNPANPTFVDTVEPGVTVSLFAPGSSTPIATTTTNAAGAYSFTGLAPGTYSVQETTPGGYVETYPVGATYTVAATGSNVNYPNNNFANFMESCNSASLTNVVYKDNGNVIAGLRGNTHQGDTVSVTFTVPANVPTETLSLVAYNAPASTFSNSTASQQSIANFQTGTFTPGTYTETVTLPNSFYQVDFVCGAPITQFGPANSNIFYGSQGRLIDADNGGAQPFALSSLSGTVYADNNGNDALDGGDTGLGGVTVYLANAAGTAVLATTTTASNGTYSFTNLAPATYIVAEFPPSGYTGENPNVGSVGGTASFTASSSLEATTSIALNSNTAGTGYNFGQFLPSSISGTVYVDASGSGLTTANVPPANSGDTPEAGVTVKVTGANGFSATTVTAANGTYSFTNLPIGTYTVSEAIPSGQFQTGPNSVTYVATTTAAAPSSTGNNFANYLGCSTAGLNNVQYFVNGKQVSTLSGNGVEGATVTVTFNVAAGAAPIMLSLATYEAAYPYFTIYNVSQQVLVGDQTGTFGPGNHSLTVTLPDSYFQVDFVCGAPIVHFGPGGSNVDYGEEGRFINGDIGGTNAYATSSLAGTVYIDNNGNGTFGTGDTGLANVPVTLTGTTYVGANLVGTTLTPITVTATTTTSSTGAYSFGNLAPGTYTITETTPSGYITETANVGTVGGTAAVGSISSVPLNSNTAATGYNFGELGSTISGTVYVDALGNGLTTANVPPAGSSDTPEAGVTVNLYNSSGTLVASTTSAANGTYSFTGYPLATYTVSETVPANHYQTGPNALSYDITTTPTSPNSTGDNFSNYLACSTTGLTNVYYGITTTAGVTTYVGSLTGNVTQGETVTAYFTIAPGASPIMLSLVAYEASASYYSSSNVSQQVITSVATGTYGPGNYSQAVTIPNSYFQVDFVCGAPLAQLEANGSHVDYNFENRLISYANGGTQAYALSTLSGIVYNDANGNGTYGSGDTGLGGVTVYLFNAAGTVQLATTTTASNGTYSFTNLAPGAYLVTEFPPTGYTGENPNAGSVGGSASYNTGSKLESIGSIPLNSNTAASGYNFGQYKAASIAGTVYVDRNFDDLYDCSDTGLGGVNVYLETLGGAVVASTTSASNGGYSFTGVAPGTYQIVEGKPGGYTVENGTAGTAGGTAGLGSITSISLASGANATGYNLAQFKMASSCGYYCTSSGQWQVLTDCGGWWSSNLGNWMAQNCPTLCGSDCGSNNMWGQNNWSVCSFMQNMQNQWGANSMQCEMLTACLDEYFGKC